MSVSVPQSRVNSGSARGSGGQEEGRAGMFVTERTVLPAGITIAWGMINHTLHALLLASIVPALGIVLTAGLQLIPDKALDETLRPDWSAGSPREDASPS